MADGNFTDEQLRCHLSYDQETGLFTRLRPTSGNAKVGQIAGMLKKTTGYCLVGVCGKKYPAHRLAWLFVHGRWPDGEIDHINGIRSDNRIRNLREVSREQNCHNLHGPYKNNKSSSYLGVHYDKARKKWAVNIKANGVHRKIGRFASEFEAAEAYRMAKIKFHHTVSVNPAS